MSKKIDFKEVSRIARILYRLFIRRILVKLIDNPNSNIDEVVIAALDRVFNYKQ